MDVMKIAKKLAETYGSPCNFSPLDDEMEQYCATHYGDCPVDRGNFEVTCWCRAFEKWEKEENDK